MTSPLLVQTSIVVKSTEASTSQWASRKVFQVDCRLRSGAGSIPCAFRILPTVLSAGSCQASEKLVARALAKVAISTNCTSVEFLHHTQYAVQIRCSVREPDFVGSRRNTIFPSSLFNRRPNPSGPRGARHKSATGVTREAGVRLTGAFNGAVANGSKIEPARRRPRLMSLPIGTLARFALHGPIGPARRVRFQVPLQKSPVWTCRRR